MLGAAGRGWACLTKQQEQATIDKERNRDQGACFGIQFPIARLFQLMIAKMLLYGRFERSIKSIAFIAET